MLTEKQMQEVVAVEKQWAFFFKNQIAAPPRQFIVRWLRDYPIEMIADAIGATARQFEQGKLHSPEGAGPYTTGVLRTMLVNNTQERVTA